MKQATLPFMTSEKSRRAKVWEQVDKELNEAIDRMGRSINHLKVSEKEISVSVRAPEFQINLRALIQDMTFDIKSARKLLRMARGYKKLSVKGVK